MIETFDKGTVFFILSETGQEDRIFTGINEAREAFNTPNLGAEKIIARGEVVQKKVQTVIDEEVP